MLLPKRYFLTLLVLVTLSLSLNASADKTVDEDLDPLASDTDTLTIGTPEGPESTEATTVETSTEATTDETSTEATTEATESTVIDSTVTVETTEKDETTVATTSDTTENTEETSPSLETTTTEEDATSTAIDDATHTGSPSESASTATDDPTHTGSPSESASTATDDPTHTGSPSESETISTTQSQEETTTEHKGHYAPTGDESVVVVLGILLAIFMIAFLLLFLYVIHHRQYTKRVQRADDYAFDNTEMDITGDGIERIRETDIRVMTDPLGEGRFGDILPGEIQRGTRRVDVAFKTLKAGSSDLERSGFMAQLSLYNRLDPHPHIVQFYGLCSVGGQLYAAFELTSNGNLRNFLRRNGVDESEPEAEAPEINLNRTMLLNFAYETALALQYLESKRIVHREVMARHVLLTGDCTCKLAGLNETQRSDENIHIRWISPESLQNGLFTSKSDVWAFGVLLYEIMTLGGQPYPDIASKELPVLLQQEYVMPIPDNCEPMIYDIMRLCWDFEPDLRPEFSVLSSQIKIVMETVDDSSEMAIDIEGLEDQ